MSDSYPSLIPVPLIGTTGAVDLAATYTAMASVNSQVQNHGPGKVLVYYQSSATAPTASQLGGTVLAVGDVWQGNAAHCFAVAFGTVPSYVSVSLV